MPRWITITKVPFDYRWPDASAITAFTEAGELFVKDEVADYAIGKGYATEGKPDGSTARSSKVAPKAKTTRPRKSVKPVDHGATPDIRSDTGMVRADTDADGAAPAGSAVGPVAGE